MVAAPAAASCSSSFSQPFIVIVEKRDPFAAGGSYPNVARLGTAERPWVLNETQSAIGDVVKRPQRFQIGPSMMTTTSRSVPFALIRY